MNDEKTYLSQEKHNELKKELERLTTKSRKEVAEKLEYAKSLGDLSENTEYQEARESQASIEERIATIETLLKSAEIVKEHKGDTIDIGSTVTVRKGDQQEEYVYKLVGSEEADVPEGRISNHSPLGEALMGKRKGDTMQYQTPNGKVDGIIIKVT